MQADERHTALPLYEPHLSLTPTLSCFAQVAAAGPLLGHLSLGFALSSLGSTPASDLGLAAALTAAKLVLMPLLYTAFALAFDCPVGADLLTFLASLPASASVYSLALTRNLSPSVIGPMVPLSMMLTVALALLPLHPVAAHAHAETALRGLIAIAGVVGLRMASGAASAGAKKKTR